MSDVVSGRERRKATFLSEYKRLCLRYDMMVIQVARDNYSPMSVAELCDNPAELNKACEEMLIEPLRSFEHE